ncbi:GFA family protein [Parerythrobacter lacustris]|uniref:GFA family protein n=1 Tax=Parerythrobacter lacustris TaxID=2969984 RepID=A0ABT1XMS7_9SPHN|nr:GFA family protein [Parerythrobacter lacustris]MCR2832961.1 GFA family protein [Parerythrobacter lacustris]
MIEAGDDGGRLAGSCLCGGVRYDLARLDGPIGHCHCVTCRKAHAAPFTTTARVRVEDFRWTAGEELLRGYESSAGKRRMFCGQCGSQIVAVLANSDQMVLRVATLDDDPGKRPVAHIWTSHDAPWLEVYDLPSHLEWADK